MDDPVSSSETIRLFHAGHKNTIARWENVYRMWYEQKPLSYIAWWIGKSESTVRQLLKRAHIHRMQMGNPWPVDDKGRKICDIPHPMTAGDDPRQWCHNREFRLTGPGRWFCPVCKRAYSVGRPLIEVLLEDMKYDNTGTSTAISGGGGAVPPSGTRADAGGVDDPAGISDGGGGHGGQGHL